MESERINKDEAWDFAIGMMRLAGGEPDPEDLELIEKEKNGEITLEEIKAYYLRAYDESGRNK